MFNSDELKLLQEVIDIAFRHGEIKNRTAAALLIYMHGKAEEALKKEPEKQDGD
jgi:hypothetical protein